MIFNKIGNGLGIKENLLTNFNKEALEIVRRRGKEVVIICEKRAIFE